MTKKYKSKSNFLMEIKNTTVYTDKNHLSCLHLEIIIDA